MGLVRKAYDRWAMLKAVLLGYLLSFVAGSLSSSMANGTISKPNQAAMYIMLAAVCLTIGIFATVGVRRWRAGRLPKGEKWFMCFSTLMFVVLFILGWQIRMCG